MNKSINKNQILFALLFALLLALGLLIWALPGFYRNDIPTPPCVTSVWNEGLPNEYSVEVCK